VGVNVTVDKTKNCDGNDLKLGTLVVLDILPKAIDLDFIRSNVTCTESASLHIFGLLPNL